jgi:hypothetical protein
MGGEGSDNPLAGRASLNALTSLTGEPGTTPPATIPISCLPKLTKEIVNLLRLFAQVQAVLLLKGALSLAVELAMTHGAQRRQVTPRTTSALGRMMMGMTRGATAYEARHLLNSLEVGLAIKVAAKLSRLAFGVGLGSHT